MTEARSQSAALREEHEKLTSALYAARAETETVKVRVQVCEYISVCLCSLTHARGHTQAERVAYEKMVETVSESYESALEKNASLLKEMGELRETITKLQMDVAKGNSLLEGVVKEKEAMEAQVKTGLDIQAALKKLASDATAALSVVRDEVLPLLWLLWLAFIFICSSLTGDGKTCGVSRQSRSVRRD